MTNEEIEQYLLQSLNMALGNTMQGESSYTNSFTCKVVEGGFLFLPRLPAGYFIDNDLYQKIFLIANAALYPMYTVLKQTNAYFVPIKTDDIHVQRGLFFPMEKGISQRLVIRDLDSFFATRSGDNIPIMGNLSINYNRVTSMAIAGNSGAGKSYVLTYFLSALKKISALTIVDPKFDSPSRWARINGLTVIHPQPNRSRSDFLSTVTETLSGCVQKIHERQAILYDNPSKQFKHITVVIDELLALSEGVNKSIREAFFSLLSEVALLGRATKVHLLLVSQRFDHTTIPVSVREQMNVLMQVGNINHKTTQFLFPDLDPTGVIIPSGAGTGLIQIIDNEQSYQVRPLLCPTYYTQKGIA